MTATIAIGRVTLRQLVARKLIWVLVVMAGFPALMMLLAGRSMTDDRAYEFLNEGPIALTMLVVIPITSLILGSAALGDERRGDTLSFITLRPIARWQIVAAKAASAWLVSTAIAATGAMLAAAALGLLTGDWSLVLPMAVLAALNAAGYIAIFIPLGYITERAVLIGLAFVFLWESGLTIGVDALAPFSISRIGLSAYAGLAPDAATLLEEPLGTVVPGAGGALVKTVVLVALGVAVTAALLKRRDLT